MADSTINGLTALVGSDVDQTADQFAVWDNSAATTKKITRTNVMNGPLVGDVGSAVRAAADAYGGVSFDGVTNNTRIMSTVAAQSIGTGDFSVWIRALITPASALKTLLYLTPSSTAGSSGTAFVLFFEASGRLECRFKGAASGDYRDYGVDNFCQTYAGKVVDIVVTRKATGLVLYVNGAVVPTNDGGSAGTAPDFTTTVDSTYVHVGGSHSTWTYDGRIYRAVVFNRALSASDVAELSVSGVNPADQWGTQAPVISGATGNGNFETWTTPGTAGVSNGAATNWLSQTSGAGNTVTRNASSPISGTYDALMTRGATPGYAQLTTTGIYLVPAKRYRYSLNIKRTSGTSRIGFGYYAPPYGVYDVFDPTTGSVVNHSVEFISVSTQVYIKTLDPNSTIQVDEFVIERIGAIVDLDLGCGIGYQAHDRSTNLLHGTLFGGVSWTSPKKSGTVYGTTSTNGNQLLLGTASIPADATITSMVVNSGGATPDITIGNVSGGTQLLGISSLSGNARELLAPLTLPISTTGNLWIASSSADTLNWTINYTTSF